DLVDLRVDVLLRLRRAEPRPLDGIELVRRGDRRVVACLVLLREALDRAGAVREDVVDRLAGLRLRLDRRREREGAAVLQLDSPARALRPCAAGSSEDEGAEDRDCDRNA